MSDRFRLPGVIVNDPFLQHRGDRITRVELAIETHDRAWAEPVAAVLSRIEFKNLPIETELRSRIRDYEVEVRTQIGVRERDTGRPTYVSDMQRFNRNEVESADDLETFLIDRVVERVRFVWSHEIDECLLYQGKRIRDPHEGTANSNNGGSHERRGDTGTSG